MIKLDALIPTQAGLRNLTKLAELTAAVHEGRYFTEERLIDLTKFEDGKVYVHNGHHRVVACCMAGRDHLRADEYRVKDWEYARYLEVNFEMHFLTPFDPLTEVRKADFKGFWEAVTHVQMHEGIDAALMFIHRHRFLYCQPRNVWTVGDLATRARAVLAGGFDPDFTPYLRVADKADI